MTSSKHTISGLSAIDPQCLLNGVPYGIAVLDLQFCIVSMNHFLEAITGYFSADVIGIHNEFILRTSLGHRDQLFKDVLDTGESKTVEGNIISKTRKKYPIKFTISPLYTTTDESAGVQLVLEDLSLSEKSKSELIPFTRTREILGHSPQMQEIFELIPVLSQTDASVLITGETGTGKDMIAEAIHRRSKRQNHPFIKINCGALPESLLESELFGHVKGAFTGACQNKPGLFRLAHGGTLFLTEIGDLPLPLQIKLLSVLDDHEFFPVGGSKKVHIDARIFAATHRSLKEYVEQGKFREDLFYRLNVLRLHLPALRDREGDIRLLLDHFLKIFDTLLKKGSRKFSVEALEILTHYRYTGNVREVRNIAEYASNICQGKTILPQHLPAYIFEENLSSAQEQKVTEDNNINSTTTWRDLERKLILEALQETKGNKTKAAVKLGWGRTTLWRKMSQHKIV